MQNKLIIQILNEIIQDPSKLPSGYSIRPRNATEEVTFFLYHNSKRIGHIQCRLTARRWLKDKSRKDLEKALEEIKFPDAKVFVVTASHLDEIERGKGLGSFMYASAIEEAGKRGGVLLGDSNTSSSTSSEARKIWNNSTYIRKYAKIIDSIAIPNNLLSFNGELAKKEEQERLMKFRWTKTNKWDRNKEEFLNWASNVGISKDAAEDFLKDKTISESSIAEPAKENKDIIDKFRSDYLTLLRNCDRVKNYQELESLQKALRLYKSSLEATFSFYGQYKSTIDMGRMPIASALKNTGLSTEQSKSIAMYWRDELWAFLSALGTPYRWSKDERRSDEKMALEDFESTKKAWKASVDRYARKFWKRVKSGFDLLDQKHLDIQVPKETSINVKGHPVVLIGYQEQKQKKYFEKMKLGLETALDLSRKKFPALFPKNLIVVFDFIGDSFESFYHKNSLLGDGHSLFTLTYLAHDQALKTILHEAAHHYYQTILSKQAKDYWGEIFLANQNNTMDLKKLVSIWEKHPDSSIYRLQSHEIIEKFDRQLAIQLNSLVELNALRKKAPPFESLDDVQKLIKDGKTVQVPKMLASWYSGKNSEEMFTETVAYYLTEGNKAVPEYLIKALKDITSSDIKESLLEGTTHSGWELVSNTSFSVTDSDDDYYYHVTKKQNVRSILSDGVSPGKAGTMGNGFYSSYSKGKAFICERSGVEFWVNAIEQHLEYNEDDSELAILRIPKESIGDIVLHEDEVGLSDSNTKSYYATYTIQSRV